MTAVKATWDLHRDCRRMAHLSEPLEQGVIPGLDSEDAPEPRGELSVHGAEQARFPDGSADGPDGGDSSKIGSRTGGDHIPSHVWMMTTLRGGVRILPKTLCR